eukprot:gene34612-42696_t
MFEWFYNRSGDHFVCFQSEEGGNPKNFKELKSNLVDWLRRYTSIQIPPGCVACHPKIKSFYASSADKSPLGKLFRMERKRGEVVASPLGYDLCSSLREDPEGCYTVFKGTD